jgi:hypothetical protein
VPLRLKSASSPCPTASWSKMPLSPGASTTSIWPAGASSASSMRRACRAASSACHSGDLLVEVAECRAPAAAGGALLTLAVALGDHVARRTERAAACRAPSGRPRSRRGSRGAPRRSSLRPSRCESNACAARLGPLEQRALRRCRPRRSCARARSASGRARARAPRALWTPPCGGDLRGGLGRAKHGVPVEVSDVGVARGVARMHAHAEAHRHPRDADLRIPSS